MDNWDDLPETYMQQFSALLAERGMAEEFNSLPPADKDQILEILRSVLKHDDSSQENQDSVE